MRPPLSLLPGIILIPNLTDPPRLPGLGQCVGSCTPSPSQAFALAFWQHPGGSTFTNETDASSCLLQEEYLALLRREGWGAMESSRTRMSVQPVVTGQSGCPGDIW